MGCLLGKQDINDIHPDIFSVHNIDHEGRCTTTGNIKITANTLELIRLGMSDMIWPLKSLRQYGHDADIFTFESGRRGPQGPGVYSFRCSRAKQLFELVQRNVHRNKEEQSSRRISLGTIIDPTPNNEPVSPPPIFEPVPPLTSLASPVGGTEFTNVEYINVEPRQIPQIPIPPTTPVEPNTPHSPYERLEQSNDQYENVTIPPSASVALNSEKQQNKNLPPIPLRTQAEDPKVSYATLELNPVENTAAANTNTSGSEIGANNSSETNNNETVEQAASGSGGGTNGGTIIGTNGTIIGTNIHHQNSTTEENNGPYAMINLDMTQALSALNAGQTNPRDEGIRRTRHNSTLEGISSFSTNGKIVG